MGVTIIMLPLLLLFTVISAAKLQDRAVTPRWEAVCDTSHLFSEDHKNWKDASGECELYGGNLAQIRSMELNYCILRHAHSKNLPAEGYWHSGNDMDDEGVYRYNRARDLILWSPIWADGRPQGGKAENCLYVSLSSDGHAGHWNDHPCTAALRYVCQRKL